MLEYLGLVVVGCLLGVVTGLIPGLHVNTIALVGISLYSRLSLSGIDFSVVMISMAVTHTFLDFIPVIYVGVPNEDTALSVLPAHKMVLEGRALDAVYITAAGSIMGLVFALLLLAPALYLIPIVFNALRPVIAYVLVFAVSVLIVFSGGLRKMTWSIIVFTLAGVFGLVVLDLKILSSSQVLFPVFAGLFGLSNILYSISSKPTLVPQKEYSSLRLSKNMVGAGFVGTIGGILVGILPALSPSQVGLLLWRVFGSNLNGFLVSVSAINTSDAIYSLVALQTLGNARSGVATMIGEVLDFGFSELLVLVGAIAVSGFIATILHIHIGRRANRVFAKLDYFSLNLAVVAVILALVFYFTGFVGLFVAVTATCIGLIPILAGVSRTHLMGVLILPTILFYLGIS